MEMKEAIAFAKLAVIEAFQGEDIAQIRLEEIELKEDLQEWNITFGLYRPAVNARFNALGAFMSDAQFKKSYRVVRVSNNDGKVLSIRIRESGDD